MRTLVWLALLLSLFGPVGAVSADIRAVGSIRGIVLDEAGNEVAGATVTASRGDGGQRLGETDASGAFALSDLPPGIYALEIEREFFAVSVVTVEIGASTSVSDLRITLYEASTSSPWSADDAVGDEVGQCAGAAHDRAEERDHPTADDHRQPQRN